ncbi:hypothetical protein GCM10007420_00730 [Glycocaulis albus]|uniref:Uncharacterized protein n=1 Tax=Glycocaulis albus TaxID=1382801 RepID=A0ABQ1XFT1_9PROT|nr:hypothetical protein [Glycocaulis albus]MBV5256870.1 hypothetical protein [Synechococcus moorigangaii CMS01]GGG89559.1 hypothetical protein GCM10007420_00730 [Glycocaulis albus]
MAEIPYEIQIFAVALVASLVIGLPVRIAGWRASVMAVRGFWRLTRRYRIWILLIALAGMIAGLWSFESIRGLVFGWWS